MKSECSLALGQQRKEKKVGRSHDKTGSLETNHILSNNSLLVLFLLGIYSTLVDFDGVHNKFFIYFY